MVARVEEHGAVDEAREVAAADALAIAAMPKPSGVCSDESRVSGQRPRTVRMCSRCHGLARTSASRPAEKDPSISRAACETKRRLGRGGYDCST